MIFGNVTNIVQTKCVVFVTEIKLEIVVAVVVVYGYAHLEHLRLVFLQIRFHVHGIVTWHDVHTLHSFFVRLVSAENINRPNIIFALN